MLLYCVRHGESTYNAEGRIQGQSDVPLSDLGRRQSRAVAEALRGEPIEALYSSPLRRAMDTALPVGEALRLPVQTDPRLMEICVGVFQHQLKSELDARFPEHIARWRSGDPDFALPGGESRRALMERGRTVIDHIARRALGRVTVVSHGGLLAAALKSLLEIPARLHPFSLRNGSITQLELTDGEVKLVTFNQTEHLRAIGSGGIGDL